MKKRLISLLLAFSMMLTFLPAGAVSAFAEETWGPYYCGQNITATLSQNSDGDETYTLTIRGTGPMKNYNYNTWRQMPWWQKIPKITRLIVCDGVTSLGDCVLHGFDGMHEAKSLIEVELPEGLTYLGDYAFLGAAKLESITLPSTLTTIGGAAFYECTKLTNIMIPSEVKTIDADAFFGCTGLTSITIPDKVETLGQGVFESCTQLTSMNIPKSVKSMGMQMFGYCDALTCITFEPGSNLTNVGSYGPWKLFTNTSSELKVYCEPVLKATLSEKDVPDDHIITTVDVKLVDGDTITPKTINYGANIAALGTPTKPGYTFTGWYTDEDCTTRYPETQLFTNINGTKLYAGWKFDPNAPSCRPLTVTGGTVTVKYDGSDVTSTLNSSTDAATGKKTYSVPEGAEVTVTLDKTQIPEGMVFDMWTTGSFSLPSEQNYKAETITFTMKKESVDIAAQYRDATIEDDGSTVLGTAAIIGTAVVGTMVLGYQAYSLGTEFAGYLMDLPYFPANRSALAVMLWEDAGKPMPESERLYPDVGQEEQDMDLQHAARWAMENDLIPDRNEEGTAPEEMKFYPDNAVSRIDVLKAWQKAQELKKNA